MKQILMTNNSLQFIDDVQLTKSVYDKADLFYKISDNAIYFYNANDASLKPKEVFIALVPIEIDGAVYNNIDDVVDVIDSFVKSDIDVQSLDSSLRIEDQLNELNIMIQKEFDDTQLKQDEAKTILNDILTRQASIDGKLTTINTTISNMNSSLGGKLDAINTVLGQQLSVLQQILAK